MQKRLEAYLKDRLNDVVFIELRKDIEMKNEKLKGLEKIQIPMMVEEMGKSIKEGSASNEIRVASMARGMIYVIGIDPNFMYGKEYREFLYKFDEKIEDYIIYEGLKYAEDKKFQEALITFRALVMLNDENINGLYNYARVCQDLSEVIEDKKYKGALKDECIEALEIIIEKYPDFAPAYYHLGFRYANKQLFKKAQITWEECMELGIDDEKKGEILFKLKELKEQIQYEEGYSYILNNRPEDGLEKLLPLEEKYSDWWNLLFFIGLAYRQLNKSDEAIKYFEKILSFKPQQVDTLNELGLCYGSTGDFNNAEKMFKKALSIKVEDSEILCNLGVLYMNFGEIDLAKEYIKKAYERNVEDPIIIECMKRLELI
ncbi:tetratricopeptide repeat protein [Anaeromicrobium sediminis]|uniref:UDP-N-acetylglucosamine--peptide N-acetylglucosaminyltransferase SPINDLY n=1 Tax=Anaeromicrobium sediminis TaxID=1478221 RepID=A0A267MIQ8_9FIRM|nr:tetratricopeptide repeat protein [Anaeromicrobium sediminis]PAB59416.1 hypothetical protein CCE28_09355 [Anaeromicrobium sediminis]